MSALVVLFRSKSEDQAREIAGLSASAGFRTVLAPSAYDIPEASPLWVQLASLGPLAAAWTDLNPRPARWLLRRHGLDAETFHYASYESPVSAFSAMVKVLPPTSRQGSRSVEDLGFDVELPPRWHPVVDKSLCDDCGQCLQFCLFGVYERDEAQSVAVSRPDSCKTGCPACSRICPRGAIMFPLYFHDPAIAGVPGFAMTPDVNARRLFYMRTKQPCPVCKAVPLGPPLASGSVCPECGGPYSPPDSPIRDDIDALIDALDAQP